MIPFKFIILGKATFYVSSLKGNDFRISTRPSEDYLYSDEFRFTIAHPQGNPTEKPYFIYPKALKGNSFVNTKLDISNYNNYPLDVAALSHKELSQNCSKIFFISRDRVGPMITLEDHSFMDCCKSKTGFSFYACNVSKSGSHSISGCLPGWYKLGKSCFMFYFQSSKQWRFARNLCHKKRSEIAIVNSAEQLKALADQRKQLKKEYRGLTLGINSKLRWVWIDDDNATSNINLWGPREPSGDGKCGAFLNAIGSSSNWAGYGWRWDDLPCTSRKGFICEEPLDVPLPVALFSAHRSDRVVDHGPNGATEAVFNNIMLATGPFGDPAGSFLISGFNNSYVEVKNGGELDTRFSVSVFAWVHPDASATRAGPIYEYGCSMWYFPSTLRLEIRYMVRDRSKTHILGIEGVIKVNAWNFVGTTYDIHAGVAAVWVNESMVMNTSIGTNVELATQGNLTIGASNNHEMQFYGKVSCLQFYDQALSVDQIMKIKTRCNQSISPATSPDHARVGCYRDTNNRAIPTLEGADPLLVGAYLNRENAIEKCALAAHKRGFRMFAVQNGGWCAASVSAEKTFHKYGQSTYCRGDGEGGPWSNDVYIIKDYKYVGCYRDIVDRAIPDLEGTDPVLDGNYRARQNAVEKCAIVARKRGFQMFAVQHHGQCLSSATAEETFDKYGKSNDCSEEGKGGPWANSVYVFRVSQSWCRPGFFPLRGGCFSINPSTTLNWQQALERCKRDGGTLAKIAREGLRATFSNILDEIRRFQSNFNSLFIGLLSKDEWTWIDGTPLNYSLWKPGYPIPIQSTRSCGYLAGGSSGIRSGECTLKRYPLCQKKAGIALI